MVGEAPATVYLLLAHDEYGDEGVHVWGAFETRDEAQRHVDRYDDAVKRSLRDSPAGGVCKVGDLFVQEQEIGGDPLTAIDKSLYLHDYLYERSTRAR